MTQEWGKIRGRGAAKRRALAMIADQPVHEKIISVAGNQVTLFSIDGKTWFSEKTQLIIPILRKLEVQAEAEWIAKRLPRKDKQPRQPRRRKRNAAVGYSVGYLEGYLVGGLAGQKNRASREPPHSRRRSG